METNSSICSSTGVKLTKRVTVSNGSSSSVTRTDYVGGFIYLNNVLSSVSLDDGRLVKNASGVFESQYYLKDHASAPLSTCLGNVRVVYGADSQGKAVELQEDHYYPYGMTMSGLSIVSSLANNYKYQGKEYQPEGFDTDGNSTLDTYLAWSDFDARFFDPQLGRWHVPDPANQYASPYVGMGNNPANSVDPDGKTKKMERLQMFLSAYILYTNTMHNVDSGFEAMKKVWWQWLGENGSLTDGGVGKELRLLNKNISNFGVLSSRTATMFIRNLAYRIIAS